MAISITGPLGVLALGCLLPWTVAAQGVEVTPIVGYGFGSDFVETLIGTAIDRNGASTVGGAMDVPIGNEGLFLEILYTHQQALFDTPTTTGPPVPLRASRTICTSVASRSWASTAASPGHFSPARSA